MPPNYGQSQGIHPKRIPAHLSVSLRHPGSDESSESQKTQDAGQGSPSTSIRELSGPSDDSGGLAPGEAPAWFKLSNENPGAQSGVDEAMMDGDPPFFLKRQSSSASIQEIEPDASARDRGAGSQDRNGLLRAATNGSSSDDYRSVIDDLTIENQRLRARLRQLDAANNGSIMKGDKLFEIKVHGLSANKRRELEQKLQNFAASIHSSTGTHSSQPSDRRPYGNLGYSSVHASSSTSNSRRVDSAYASMSISEAKPASLNNQQSLPSQTSRQQNIRSFLHDIPEGLLPRHSPVLSEKAKQRLVVKRLEQLFTGRHSPRAFNGHSQSVQQQEVSASAARADREEEGGFGRILPSEGLREAHILPAEMEVDKPTENAGLVDPNVSSTEAQSAEDTGSESLDSAEQRPTRPLDLDPDRAQIPADNMKYIRHLGIPTSRTHELDPQDAQDAPADAEGWVYLNLLINMAQLHIINVTPDFVRSAVSNLSSNFQLSPDGRKIRWRGRAEGTQFSSESGGDNGLVAGSSNNSDEFDGHSRKRHKVCLSPREVIARDRALKKGQTSMPSASPRRVSTEQLRKIYYKPLFRHHRSSQGSTSNEESLSPPSYPRDNSGSGKPSPSNRRGQTSPSISNGSKRRRTVAPMIFYGGAPFYVDLSGDWGDESPESRSTYVIDGGQNDEICPVGCSSEGPARPIRPRTESGSNLAFRPLQEYSKYAEASANAPHSSPDQGGEENIDDDIHFSPQWSSDSSAQKAAILELEATGLGGTRPADHFVMTVETRRPKLDRKSIVALSRFPAPGRKTRKLLHRFPKSSPQAFNAGEEDDTVEVTAPRRAALNSCSSHSTSRSPSPDERSSPADLPVKPEIIATQLHRLEPSSLPPPASYFSPFFDPEESEDTSESDLSESGMSASIFQRPLNREFGLHMPSPEYRDAQMDIDIHDEGNKESEEDEMKTMFPPGDMYPEMTVDREGELLQEADAKLMEELPIGSSAATVGGGSVFSRDRDCDAVSQH